MAIEYNGGTHDIDMAIDLSNVKLQAIYNELLGKLEAGQEVALTVGTLAALSEVDATITNLPADYPDTASLTELITIAGHLIDILGEVGDNGTILGEIRDSLAGVLHVEVDNFPATFPDPASTAELVDVNEHLTTMELQLDDIDTSIEAGNTILTAIDGDLDTANNTLLNIQDGVVVMSASLVDIETGVDGLEALIGTTNSTLTTIDGRVDGIEGELDTIHNDLLNANDYLQNISDLVTETDTRSVTTGNINSNGGTVTHVSPGGHGQIALQIQGTWVGTLTFEVSTDGGSTWGTYNLTSFATDTVLSSTAGNTRAGRPMYYDRFRVRASAWTSGTANIYIISSHS